MSTAVEFNLLILIPYLLIKITYVLILPFWHECLAPVVKHCRKQRRNYASLLGVGLGFLSRELCCSEASITGRVERELLRARVAHPAAGEHQAAGEGLWAFEPLSGALNCLLYVIDV